MDRTAFESDGVMFLGRVKWHTDFEGTIESGLFKMMAIGLGKFAGAGHYHTYAYKLGLAHVIRSIGREVLKSGKILGGLAILEDAYHNTAQLTAVPVEDMERREEELLALAKSWMARIPVDLDVLIVDEMGKDISGAGMDTKVVNRGSQGQYNPWQYAPRIERIFVRGLSGNTYGNAVGVGLADVVTDRLVQAIDPSPMYINSDHFFDPSAGAHPDPFSNRSRMSGDADADRRQVRYAAGAHRLDPQHAGADSDRAQREPARGDRSKTRCWRLSRVPWNWSLTRPVI